MSKALKNSICLFFLLTACQSKPPGSSSLFVAQGATKRELLPAEGRRYAISTQGDFATRAGREMFESGGNLIDAAVAASFVIAVERPHSTGIGGGGFMVFRDGKTARVFAVDFRERAPAKAAKNMFLGRDGRPVKGLSENGVLAVAVPGLVAGLLEIHERFGSLPRQKILRPAIDLAEKGFPVYPALAEALKEQGPLLARDAAAKKIFFSKKGPVLGEGETLVQADLGKTLRAIAAGGRKAFDDGAFARALDSLSKKSGGVIRASDLKNYRVLWREPLRDQYRGFEVYSMPPPSSGGLHVLQFLKFLANDRLADKGFLSAESIHLEASALQSAFADRATYLGDPDFVNVPVRELLSADYLQKRRAEVPKDRARRADEVRAGELTVRSESTETTHLSIIDSEGGMVATTQTINGWFGAGLVVGGTGVVLNNEMDDFSAQTGAQNMFGAVGGEANSIAPGKTPLSSMSPTLLLKDGKPRLAIGAPGGTRIISCVAQTILNHLEFALPLRESIAAVRLHHQWKPDVLSLDPPGPGEKTVQELRRMGYRVELKPVPCNVMAVSQENGLLSAVSDPRDIGTAFAR
ncbi:MAG: gamma-glutamyltransferase [Bdellovibrionaceae bacterium]|nr:gamma-glutamyltransferase [Pseudobdellovibrionaceae bacterium]